MSSACQQCMRRAWLTSQLRVNLDYRARDRLRLFAALELADDALIDALGGRRREELRSAYRQPTPRACSALSARASICRHQSGYPRQLRGLSLAPHALSVHGCAKRFQTTIARKVVSIVGTRRASDYGLGVARELAHQLATCGITVASGLSDGICAAVHQGALEADGTSLAVAPFAEPERLLASCRAQYRELVAERCVVSELGTNGRVWPQAASERTLALLAEAVVVVEAGEHPHELVCAQLAKAHGRSIAAVPGRVTSRAAQGSNALLREGAQLVRDAQDVLDTLFGFDAHRARTPERPGRCAPHLRRVLEQVSDGHDTIAKLSLQGIDTGVLALLLAELELSGWLVRGDGGRYLVATPKSVLPVGNVG